MKKFDFTTNNIYFITLCVKDNICCLSTVYTPINNSKPRLRLTLHGQIIKKQIEHLKEQYEYLHIHNYVIMPNHIHLIIELDENKVLQQRRKAKSISVLLTLFKMDAKRLIRAFDFPTFSWQRINHQHIIQEYDIFRDISAYISTNHQKWEQDPFFNTKKRHWSYPDE